MHCPLPEQTLALLLMVPKQSNNVVELLVELLFDGVVELFCCAKDACAHNSNTTRSCIDVLFIPCRFCFDNHQKKIYLICCLLACVVRLITSWLFI